jgi:hypothetical protein
MWHMIEREAGRKARIVVRTEHDGKMVYRLTFAGRVRKNRVRWWQ